MRRIDSGQNPDKGSKKKFQFTPTPLIGVGLGVMTLLVWFSHSVSSETKNAAPQKTIAGCTSADELEVLQKKALSDDTIALETLLTKGESGDPCAQYALASFYRTPKFSKDVEAVKWIDRALLGYQKAAKNGDIEAQYSLGMHYWYIKHDFDNAVQWWSKAAEAGHSLAQNELGSYYSTKNNQSDNDKALKWWRKAAEQGNARAMFNLGTFYDDAIQRKPDYEAAAKWYRQAAEQNFTLAQRFLSNMYARGEGVPQSWKNAYFWGCVAERCFANAKKTPYNLMMSYPSREQTDSLEGEKHLVEKDLQEIMRQAAGWKPGLPPPL